MGTKHYMPTFKPTIPFVPTDIGGCQLWLRSDLGITKDGDDRVSDWADQSGIGHDVSQADADKKPIYIANQLNGYPAIRFDGINDFMATASFAWDQPRHLFVVAKILTTGAFKILFDGLSPYNAVVIANSPDRLRLYAGGYACDTSIVTSTYYLIEILFNATSSRIRLNGGTANTGNAGTYNVPGFKIGALSSGGYNGNFDLVEVAGYNSLVSDSDRQKVENYLNGRYAIY